MKCYSSIVFGLIIIWTGLMRCIEAEAFKPNAFWFCLTMGLASIGAGYLFRLNRDIAGQVVAGLAGMTVLAFYLYCLLVQPEKDATYRVAIAIVASIAHLSLAFLPQSRK